MKPIIATPNDHERYPKWHPKPSDKERIFMAANAFRFGWKDAGTQGDFIKMSRVPGQAIIEYRRNAKGKTDSYRNPTHSYASAFPLFCYGTLNNRECWGEEDGTPRLSPHVKRDYDYPAYDLRHVSQHLGVPCMLDTIPRDLSVELKVDCDFVGCNGMMDMYAHDEVLKGYGRLNGGTGYRSKVFNLNYWWHRPVERNGGSSLGNGWTGAEKIGEWNVDGRNIECGLKLETVGDNEFLYVSIVQDDTKHLILNVWEIWNWFQSVGWPTIQKHRTFKKIARRMQKPPTLTEFLVLCGLHMGNEIWWSDPNVASNKITYSRVQVTANGRTFSLIPEDAPNDDVPVPTPRDPAPERPMPLNPNPVAGVETGTDKAGAPHTKGVIPDGGMWMLDGNELIVAPPQQARSVRILKQ